MNIRVQKTPQWFLGGVTAQYNPKEHPSRHCDKELTISSKDLSDKNAEVGEGLKFINL